MDEQQGASTDASPSAPRRLTETSPAPVSSETSQTFFDSNEDAMNSAAEPAPVAQSGAADAASAPAAAAMEAQHNVADPVAAAADAKSEAEAAAAKPDGETGDAKEAQDGGMEAEAGGQDAKADVADETESRIKVERPDEGAQQSTSSRPPLPVRSDPPSDAPRPGSVPTAPAAVKRETDPEVRRAQFRERVDKEPRDGEAWLALIEDADMRSNLEETRLMYEGFFEHFPNAARQWQNYANMELELGNFAEVEKIFTRCLRTTPSVELWRFYLSYTRRVNPLPPPSSTGGGGGSSDGPESEREKARKVIEGAYDFALKYIGQSRDSGEVWREYLTLLKEREAVSQWQQGQKMDEIRRAYQRCVAIPLANVEQLWREYDQYENGLNKITAKKFLAERSPAYMTARTAFREMRSLTDALPRPILPRVPSWTLPPTSTMQPTADVGRERMQIEAWKKYLRWEETNPLELEDQATLHSRVAMAYRKATMHMRFYPEVWYMAAQYASATGRPEEAETWLKSGIEACPGSFLLHFAYVEQAETRQQTSDCGKVFTDLIDWCYKQIDGLQAALNASLAAIDAEGEAAAAEVAAAKAGEGADQAILGEEREDLRKLQEKRDEKKEQERGQVQPRIEEMKEAAALVWIKYMHFVRRNEGLRPCRAIFGRARKSPHCTWQVFEANALMEYHCSKDVGVASKVFELALKTFGRDEAFVVRYLDFLIGINDDVNARALFERTVATFAPERARPIWDRWCDYEYGFGDRVSIQKLEERLKETYPDEPPIKRFVERSSYMDIDVIGTRDLGFESAYGGSSAADRAVAASREVLEAAEGVPSAAHTGGAMSMAGVPTGPSAASIDAEAARRRMTAGVKRAREDGDGSTPPLGFKAARGPTGTSPVQRRMELGGASQPVAAPPVQPQQQQPVAPPQRPLPYGGQPGFGPSAGVNAGAPPNYIDVPEGVAFFLGILPPPASFDGPRIKPDDILDCLARSSVQLPAGMAPGGGGFGFGAGKRRDRGAGFGRNRRY